MKILIISNYLKKKFDYLPRFLKKFLDFYINLKLKYIIKSLKKTHQNNVSIKVLDIKKNKFTLKNNIETISFSDLRFNLKRDEYIKLRNKIINTTKQNLIKLFNNIGTSIDFNYEGISIAKILEIDLVFLFNEYLGQYELLERILNREHFDRIILFNFNHMALPLYQSLNFNHNIEVCKDGFLVRSHKFFKIINISKFILISLALFFKKLLLRGTKNHSIKNRKNTILFITDTKNQFYSIKPVFDNLLKYENINPVLYSCETFLELSKITKLLRYLFRIRKTISFNREKITNGLYYKTFNFYNFLSIFYNYNLFIYLIKIFNIINNLMQFIGNNLPALVVIANDYSKRGRSEIGYFKLKNIPVVYIPHAGIPIMEELATNSEVSYITVAGELENKYLINKGEPKNKIIVTGRPRYQHFHEGKIQRLLKLRDMFDARKYEFSANKFTILLTTSPIDDKSNEKILSSVVNSLKELNIIDNLIIKLHPRENGRIHQKVLDKLEVNPIIVKDYDILELVASSNLLLSGISNTVLEAMIIGTPVILLDFINVNFTFTSRYIFTEDKSLISVKDQKELTDILQKLIKNKDFYNKYSEDLKNLSEGYSFYDKTQNPTEKTINLFFKEINYNKKGS